MPVLLNSITDIHTHTQGIPGSILSATPSQALALAETNESGQCYSLELHPWRVSETLIQAFREAADRCEGDPHLLAIGECGLDTHGQVPMEQQRVALDLALRTARRLGLPAIIHCVGQWAEIIDLHRQYPEVKMIVHGYRKGLPLAQQLIREGIAISLGERYHPEVATTIPDELLYYETDESTLSISEIRQNILSLRPKTRT